MNRHAPNTLHVPKRTLLLQLFAIFLKIGPTTFGGGYAILPAIDRELTEKRKWLDADEMSEITALSGAAPGGIGVNVAALVGFRIAGIPGLIAAVTGIALPTIAIMLLLCAGATGFRNNSYVQAALTGIKPTVIALIVYAAVRLGRQSLHNVFAWVVTLTSTALLLWTPIHPILVLAIGSAAGLAMEWFQHGNHKHDRRGKIFKPSDSNVKLGTHQHQSKQAQG
ncbi:chromate transporter [Paenibacillus sp. OSY-SE]|uniref:chromate transporter n=1 Tax=Paenibacillus sp. OSY-SE TaxID=1196323 RepID=UPI00037368EA|nr:chromate transporter [Paenibacillus sp. OSY-SE]